MRYIALPVILASFFCQTIVSQDLSFIDPRATDYYGRFAGLTRTNDFQNPDFYFSQFRSNLVFRWEYRPGSQFNFVWSQDRTAFVQPGNQVLSNWISSLKDTFPNNIFLIKFNYWFSI